jgi:hypothetical protein
MTMLKHPYKTIFIAIPDGWEPLCLGEYGENYAECKECPWRPECEHFDDRIQGEVRHD